jgi:hypothetical protein
VIFIARSMAAFEQENMPCMISYPHRLQSEHITCSLDRTFDLLTTQAGSLLDRPKPMQHNFIPHLFGLFRPSIPATREKRRPVHALASSNVLGFGSSQRRFAERCFI